MKKFRVYFCLIILLTLFFSAGCKKWTETRTGTIRIITSKEGRTLGYDSASGVKILTVKGLAFKDFNKNGRLDNYEDWRLSADERARDLASRMSVEQIAGLMLYSAHQAIPAGSTRFGASTYNGKPFKESGAKPYDLSDQQKKFLTEDNLRHILVTTFESPETAAIWNNKVQALCEGLGLGIPANNSSDPRHRATSDAEYNIGSAGQISMWPGSLGMAATFDPEVVRGFGRVASKEYRALGITTALSPQIDIATEPRWLRVSGTFGESPELSADMARAYADGFQTSEGDNVIADGWGYTSVNTMIKHWPGGGSGEAGRDAHFSFGKYAVYPGKNFKAHLIPFTEGGMKLEGATKSASAVMPYYTISWGIDTVNHENVGNAYSRFLITGMLRDKYGFDGVVYTDWGVTNDEKAVDGFGTTCWGVENLSVPERHYKIIMAGVDQFGGNNDAGPVMEAYKMGVKEHGEEFMRSRMEQSAVRLLRNIFRTGLFENPYLDPDDTKKTVGNEGFMKAGYDAQLKSIVLLKNRNKVLPAEKMKTIYIPKRKSGGNRDFFGGVIPVTVDYPINIDLVRKYFKVTENPAEAYLAFVVIRSPSSGNGYSAEDVAKGGNGYVPISLQYRPYKAVDARATSIAGGDLLEKFTNRSYKNKSVTASNSSDLDLVLNTRKSMKDKPVIVSIAMSNPMVFNEFEKEVDAILVNFEVQDQAILDIITGSAESYGLLPLQMPSGMKTVELQSEDVPFDMECHKDSEGNTYDFGFGMNWKGIIKDQRTEKYGRKQE
jgi:beta-glucosidase